MKNTGEENQFITGRFEFVWRSRDVPEHLGLWSELRREVQAADGDPGGNWRSSCE